MLIVSSADCPHGPPFIQPSLQCTHCATGNALLPATGACPSYSRHDLRLRGQLCMMARSYVQKPLVKGFDTHAKGRHNGNPGFRNQNSESSPKDGKDDHLG